MTDFKADLEMGFYYLSTNKSVPAVLVILSRDPKLSAHAIVRTMKSVSCFVSLELPIVEPNNFQAILAWQETTKREEVAREGGQTE